MLYSAVYHKIFMQPITPRLMTSSFIKLVRRRSSVGPLRDSTHHLSPSGTSLQPPARNRRYTSRLFEAFRNAWGWTQCGGGDLCEYEPTIGGLENPSDAITIAGGTVMRPILKQRRDTVKQCKVVPSGSSLSRGLGRVLAVSSSLERLDPDSLVVVCVENWSMTLAPPGLVDEGFSCGFGKGDVNRHTRYNFDRAEDLSDRIGSWIPITHPLVIPRPDRQIHLVLRKAWNLAKKMIVRRCRSFVSVTARHHETVNGSQPKTIHPPAFTNVGHAASPNFERAASRP